MGTEADHRQRLYRVAAIVLKRRDMGEADRLLTIMTRDRGKLTLLAKGVRRPASRKAGHVEPFTYVDLLVARSHGFDLVTQAETIEAHRWLREDLWRSTWASYVVELLDAFTQPEDPNQSLFDLLLETLDRLDRGENVPLATRYYELHLLSLVGFQPQFFHCLECGEPLQPVVNYFSLERGGALDPEHGSAEHDTIVLPLPALKVLRFLQTRPWEQVVQLNVSPDVGGQVESLLARYIVYHLEHTLNSPPFLQRIRSQLGGLGKTEGAAAAAGAAATTRESADADS